MNKKNLKRSVGRPTKRGAKKPGELNEGECRFSFISNEQTVTNIKKAAKEKGISIKDLMANILASYNPKTKNEMKLSNYLKQQSPTD